jgi:hypothetical protein
MADRVAAEDFNDPRDYQHGHENRSNPVTDCHIFHWATSSDPWSGVISKDGSGLALAAWIEDHSRLLLTKADNLAIA